uniref:UBP1-associated protein 2B-like isoform X2 n=1 Tax=Erigeron canadensis TaxID=72917 RepID=UPI001CB95DB6|nr:UBP1-associated protein 2B-like isoform X2 [Erigeron canadensis]
MVKAANKKLKTPKKPTNPTTPKKKPRKTKKKKPISKKPIITSSDSDSDSQQTTPDRIQKLIEPYSKSQLIDFVISAALSNPSFYTRIRNYADTDVSNRKIFVYGLGWDTTRENLVQGFKPYGEIEDCNVVIDRVTGKAKGFGFVQFKSRKSAFKALKNPKKRIGNRMVSCQLASLGPGKGDGKGGTGNRDNWDRKIYVSNVRQDTDPAKLRVFFERFGEIETGPLGFDTSTGKSRGFALFVYKNQDGLKKALEEPKKVFEGHQLHCQRASGGGKNKGDGGSGSSSGSGSGSGSGVGPVLQQPDPQMMAAVAASQNFGLYPMYGGFIAANAIYPPGVLGQIGGVPGGLGGYYAGAPVPHGLGIGVDSASLLGATPPMMPGLGLQNAYPMKKSGPSSGSGSGSPSGSRSQGAGGGSYSRYSSHKRLCTSVPERTGVVSKDSSGVVGAKLSVRDAKTADAAFWDPMQLKRLTDAEIADKRAKGLCFRCGGKYGPAHRGDRCPEKNLKHISKEV